MKKNNIFKKIVASKLLIATFFTLFGVFSVVFAQSLIEKREKAQTFFGGEHFKEFDRLEKEMNSVFESFAKIDRDIEKEIVKIREKSLKNQSKSEYSSKISASKKDDKYIYNLEFKGFLPEEIAVNVKDGAVTFQADKIVESQENGAKSKYSRNFHYKFSLPKDIDENPEVIRKNNNITAIFSKKSKL